ncbi:hypothetical protein [Mesorhizobium sp. ZC-5]|uniref:hypothetical protein n=1 Tax=Mesorhizobium sp. ZC-5 TaxID=2986066 RepID=UPI0021E8FB85|nr:hypothetical protein [Mesorhizobium sp. ZC-5]MCV3241787.1 hypothetical protein [Mesorhizobium sp. ZC-5]
MPASAAQSIIAARDAKHLLHDNLNDVLEFYRVGLEINTSATDKQPYDLPSMIEPIAVL